MYNKKLYLYNHFGYITCEKIYILLLKLFRRRKKYPIITKTDFEKIKEIARQAFPESLQQICEIDSEEDLLGYCHCYSKEQLYYVLTDEWYVIVAAHHNCFELVECADAKRRCNDIFRIINYVINNFKHKPIISDCRESTSLPLFLMLEKHNRIKILNDIVRERNGETMHYIKCEVLGAKEKSRRNKK